MRSSPNRQSSSETSRLTRCGCRRLEHVRDVPITVAVPIWCRFPGAPGTSRNRRKSPARPGRRQASCPSICGATSGEPRHCRPGVTGLRKSQRSGVESAEGLSAPRSRFGCRLNGRPPSRLATCAPSTGTATPFRSNGAQMKRNSKRVPRTPVLTTPARQVVDGLGQSELTPGEAVALAVAVDDPIAIADARAGNVADRITTLIRQRNAIRELREAELRTVRVAEDALVVRSMSGAQGIQATDARARARRCEIELARVERELLPWLMLVGFATFERRFGERQWSAYRCCAYIECRRLDGADDAQIRSELVDWSRQPRPMAKGRVERPRRITQSSARRMLAEHSRAKASRLSKIVTVCGPSPRGTLNSPAVASRVAREFLDDDFAG